SEELSRALSNIRESEEEMRLRWIRDEENWRKLPARAWPPVQPDADAVPLLRSTMQDKCKNISSPECIQSKFDLATALTFNHMEGDEGIRIYRELAGQGNSDGMTALGVCQLEGLPRDEFMDTDEAVRWLHRAVEKKNAQGIFEMGILYYTGSAEPVVLEDERTAFDYFEKAAELNHTSALYMVAHMMMKEEGCSQNLPRSIDLLYRAGERGHRTARATLLKILDEYA
ncbi:unnamed protein product, partial [Ectocarpus fasciculatus]